MAQLAFAFCCIVWGSSFILLERVTHAFGPVEIGIWRMFCGAAAVGLICLLCRHQFRVAGRDWVNILLVAAIANAPLQVIQGYVLARGIDHGFVGTMVAAIPLLTILISIPMLGVAPTGRELVGVIGGLLCMGVVLGDGVGRGISLGLLVLTFLVPLSSALSNTFVKWKLAHIHAGPLTAAILAMAGLSLVPLEFCRPALASIDLANPIVAHVSAADVVYLFLLGAVGSGISTMVFTWMILERGPLFAGMTTYVVPLIALVWSQLDHESISLQQIAAIVGVLAMVGLVQSRPLRSIAMPPSTADALAPALTTVAIAELQTFASDPAPDRSVSDSFASSP